MTEYGACSRCGFRYPAGRACRNCRAQRQYKIAMGIAMLAIVCGIVSTIVRLLGH